MGKKRRPSRWNYLFGLLGLVILGTGSWALYNLVNRGASDLLSYFGIENFYLQSLIVIVFVFVGLILGGAGIFKSVERLIKGQ